MYKINQCDSRTETQILYDRLDMQYLKERIKHIAIFMHKIAYKTTPPSCQNMFMPVSKVHSRNVRAHDSLNFHLLRVKLTTIPNEISATTVSSLGVPYL